MERGESRSDFMLRFPGRRTMSLGRDAEPSIDDTSPEDADEESDETPPEESDETARRFGEPDG
jgi:hypothetical protein